MKSVELRELRKLEFKKPILLAGFPGLGYVGKLAVTHMVRVLNAEKLAELYSTHFPHHVLSDDRGLVRLLRIEFYGWINPDTGGRDLVLVTGDAQVQDVEGQYLVSSEILKYAKGLGVDMVITMGGYQSRPGEKPLVVAASTSMDVLDGLREAGARVGGWGNPIVGLAGVMMGLTTFYDMVGVCFLGETLGYIVDTKAAREVLKVLARFIGLEIPLEGLERDILRGVGEAISEVEAEIRSLERILERTRERRITYIS